MAKKDEYGYTARTFLPAAETAASGRSASASGGKKRGAGYDNEGLTKAQVQEMQGYFGAEADGLWGAKSTAAAGGLGAQAAWAKYTESKAAPAAAEIGGGGQSGFRYAEAPRYTELYRQQSDALAREILSRGPFTYDPETDPAFAAYRRQYAREGQRAAADALGQYAAMTGGVPSTAAVTAARQAGDYYAAKLSDKVPELQQLAYQMYQDEQTRDMNNLNMLRALSGDDYGRFQDTLAQFNTDRDYDTGLWRYGVEDARYNAEDALNRAAIGASLGDYSGYNALGYDTSAKTTPRYSYSGGGSGSSADKATEKPTLTEAAVRANIKAGNITNDVLAAYEYYYGEPYEDSIPFFRNDTEARKWLLENDVYTGAVKGNQDLMDRREFEHRKHSGGVNDVTKGYDDYEDYINDYARYIYETRRAK